jgi:peptidoglycan/xylan/chitin deacetylase (PgdA/CDA1 family)
MKINRFLYESFYKPQRFIANIFDTPALILIYHRITELDFDPQLLAVKPDNFYKQVKYLKENYNIVSVNEFSNLINSNKKFPRGTILLSFDDGYYDNFYGAVPVLESLSTQALFYISTGLLNTNEETWWDQLEKIFYNNNLPEALSISVKNITYNFDTSGKEKIDYTYNKVHRLVKYLKVDKRKEILDKLFEWSKIEKRGRNTYRFLTFDEVKKMNESNSAVIGAHTHSHTPLSILSYEEQKNDIEKSRKILENITGKEIKHFSYPFGAKKDYNADSLKISSELNFDFVCANYYSQVHRWSDKYSLPRVLVRDWEIDYFKNFIKKSFRF